MVHSEIKDKFLSFCNQILEDKTVKTVERSSLNIYFVSLCTPYLWAKGKVFFLLNARGSNVVSSGGKHEGLQQMLIKTQHQ